MSTLVDRLSQERRTILMGSFMGFGLFYGAVLLQYALAPRSVPSLIVGAIGLAGWAVWAASLVRVTVFGRSAPSAARRALSDELWRRNVLTSWAVGFWTVLVVQIPVIVTGLQHGSELTIYVGVLAALGTFLYLDRE